MYCIPELQTTIIEFRKRNRNIMKSFKEIIKYNAIKLMTTKFCIRKYYNHHH